MRVLSIRTRQLRWTIRAHALSRERSCVGEATSGAISVTGRPSTDLHPSWSRESRTLSRSVRVSTWFRGTHTLKGAVDIDIGLSHMCARLKTGEVHCWGLNHDGVLGNGTTTDGRTPVAVSGLSHTVEISATRVQDWTKAASRAGATRACPAPVRVLASRAGRDGSAVAGVSEFAGVSGVSEFSEVSEASEASEASEVSELRHVDGQTLAPTRVGRGCSYRPAGLANVLLSGSRAPHPVPASGPAPRTTQGTSEGRGSRPRPALARPTLRAPLAAARSMWKSSCDWAQTWWQVPRT